MKIFPGSRLTTPDLLVLLIVLAYWISASVLTLMMQAPGRADSAVYSMGIAGAAMMPIVLTALWWGSRRGSISIGQFGFSLGWGMWLNVGFVLLSTVLVAGQLPLTKLSFESSALWMVLGAFTEELVFRVYLVRFLSNFISPRKGHVAWAVLISALVFTAGHLLRKTASGMTGLFISSVLAGYVTFYTKSVLFAAYWHALSNTGSQFGFLGGGVAISAYFVIAAYSSLRRRHLTGSLAPGQR